MLAKRIKNDEVFYKVLGKLTTIYQDKNEKEKTIANYEQLISYYQNTHNQSALASTYNNLAVAYYRQGNYIKNKEYLLKAYNIYIKANGKSAILNCIINLGIVEIKLKNYNIASNYLNKALARANELQNKEFLMYVYGAFDEVYKA